jgi:hypothetical protein
LIGGGLIMTDFHFCIARRWPSSKQWTVYSIHNTGVHYGNRFHAETLLEYVKFHSPNKDWCIVKIDFENNVI